MFEDLPQPVDCPDNDAGAPPKTKKKKKKRKNRSRNQLDVNELHVLRCADMAGYSEKIRGNWVNSIAAPVLDVTQTDDNTDDNDDNGEEQNDESNDNDKQKNIQVKVFVYLGLLHTSRDTTVSVKHNPTSVR